MKAADPEAIAGLAAALPSLPRDAGGPVFREPWEAQAFAMTLALYRRGLFTWNEWAETLGGKIAQHPDQSYYECWLAALENLVERKGLLTPAELKRRAADWDRAARATPHGQPIELSQS